MSSKSLFSKPVGGVTIGGGKSTAVGTSLPSSGPAAPKPSVAATGPITTALASTATLAKKPSLKELLAQQQQQQQLSGTTSSSSGNGGARDASSASLASTFTAGTRPVALSKTPVSQPTASSKSSSSSLAPVKPREFAPEATVAPPLSQQPPRSTGVGQQSPLAVPVASTAGPTRSSANVSAATAPPRKPVAQQQQQPQQVTSKSFTGPAPPAKGRSVDTSLPLSKKPAETLPSSTGANHYTAMPVTQVFPNPIPQAVLGVINGKTLERPFSTEDSKVFPPRGMYCCIRCRTPIVAAVAKVPCDVGYSGFRSFHTRACRVAVVVGDQCSNLHVTCGKCNAFLGILTQDIPQSAAAFCTSNELLKVNSCALWFVDGDADAVDGLQENHFTTTSDGGRGQGRAGSSPSAPVASRSSSAAPLANKDDDEDDCNSDSGDDLLAVTDFDNLDVIGTSDGAVLASRRRREQRASWRHVSATDRTPAVKPPPAVDSVPRSVVEPGGIGKAVSTQQRRQLAEEAMNVHSDESEPPSSDDDNDDESTADE